jgi:hypothetical protein
MVVSSQENGENNNEKEHFYLMAAAGALCIGFDSASASLLGMPLNLRVAIELISIDALARLVNSTPMTC